MTKKLFAGMLAFGLALAGNAAAYADPALNGTWLDGNACSRLILSNGNWTLQHNEGITGGAWLNAIRGTFTARDGTIAFHVTHLHRNWLELAAGPEWLDRNAARSPMLAFPWVTEANVDRILTSYFAAVAIGTLWGASALRVDDALGNSLLEIGDIFARQ